MFDGLFIINSALNVKQLSVFNTEERFEQTCETIESIDKYCPNSIKVIFDASPYPVENKYLKKLTSYNNTWFLDVGSHDEVKELSLEGKRSEAETYAFMGVLTWLRSQDFKAKRIYKLSGRYTLTDNFVLDDPSYKDVFVFAKALDSWMPKNRQDITGAEKLYRLRLWHMDFDLLPIFDKELEFIYQECAMHGIDVEHAYWKCLHNFKIVEVEKIGVKGIIAPSGEVIDE